MWSLCLHTQGKAKKIDVKSIECIFLGYNETSKAYRFYNLSNMTIKMNGNVVFNETNGLLKIVGGIVDEKCIYRWFRIW